MSEFVLEPWWCFLLIYMDSYIRTYTSKWAIFHWMRIGLLLDFLEPLFSMYVTRYVRSILISWLTSLCHLVAFLYYVFTIFHVILQHYFIICMLIGHVLVFACTYVVSLVGCYFECTWVNHLDSNEFPMIIFIFRTQSY